MVGRLLPTSLEVVASGATLAAVPGSCRRHYDGVLRLVED